MNSSAATCDPELREVVERWAEVSPELQSAILNLIRQLEFRHAEGARFHTERGLYWLLDLPEEECEALAQDATLREL